MYIGGGGGWERDKKGGQGYFRLARGGLNFFIKKFRGVSRFDRTWTILWTAHLLSKSDHGMATPELMEVHNDGWVKQLNSRAQTIYLK